MCWEVAGPILASLAGSVGTGLLAPKPQAGTEGTATGASQYMRESDLNLFPMLHGIEPDYLKNTFNTAQTGLNQNYMSTLGSTGRSAGANALSAGYSNPGSFIGLSQGRVANQFTPAFSMLALGRTSAFTTELERLRQEKMRLIQMGANSNVL